MRTSLLLGLFLSFCGWGSSSAWAIESWLRDPASSAATEANAVQRIPFQRINGQAQENLRAVVDRPSFFRRLPTQTVECDQELFLLFARYPEIIVNIWDLMGITKVEVKRVAPYVFTGQDGAGTTCRCELLYGTSDTHVYYGNGTYSGTLTARPIEGRCVCILHSSPGTNAAGRPTMTVSMDIFMKLDNIGADLVTRTLAPLVGKTADYNFVESAKFVAQLNQLCEENPLAAQQLAERLHRVDPPVRAKFAQVAANIAAANSRGIDAAQVARLPDSSLKTVLPSAKRALPANSADTGPIQSGPSPIAPVDSAPLSPTAVRDFSQGGIIVPAKPPISLRR